MITLNQKKIRMIQQALDIVRKDASFGMCSALDQAMLASDIPLITGIGSLVYFGITRPADADPTGTYWYPRDKTGQSRRIIILQEALIRLYEREQPSKDVSVHDDMTDPFGKTERASDRLFPGDWRLVNPILCDYIDQSVKKSVEDMESKKIESELRRTAIRVVNAATDCGSKIPVITYANSNRVDQAIKELNETLKLTRP